MTKRISAIDWIKLVLAGFVLCLHYGEIVTPWMCGGERILLGANLAVEVFFLISGFLFMQSVASFEKREKFPSCPKVVFHRYLGILYWLLPAVILDAAIVATGVEQLALDELALRIPKLLFEVVPLQMAGFTAWHVTGVSWYISSLLLGVLFFYPLAKRNRRAFALEICPIIAVVFYGIMYHTTGTLGDPAGWLYDVVRKGLVRGLADMAMGCFLYECVCATKAEAISVARRVVYTVAAAVSAAVCVLIMVFTHNSFFDYIFVPFAFAFLYLALGQKTVFALFLNHEWTKHVGTLSTVVFLVHFPLARYFSTVYNSTDSWDHFGAYLAYVAGSSVVVFAAGLLFKRLVALLRERRELPPEDTEDEMTVKKEAQ